MMVGSAVLTMVTSSEEMKEMIQSDAYMLQKRLEDVRLSNSLCTFSPISCCDGVEPLDSGKMELQGGK